MRLFCIDTSAWHHARHPLVAQRWLEYLQRDALAVCDQARLEILFSARSATNYDEISDELAGLHYLPIDADVFQLALDTQRRLAFIGGLHHRSVKIADLLIAASAKIGGATVLHYDADFDRIADITGQPVQWIAERGSL